MFSISSYSGHSPAPAQVRPYDQGTLRLEFSIDYIEVLKGLLIDIEVDKVYAPSKEDNNFSIMYSPGSKILQLVPQIVMLIEGRATPEMIHMLIDHHREKHERFTIKFHSPTCFIRNFEVTHTLATLLLASLNKYPEIDLSGFVREDDIPSDLQLPFCVKLPLFDQRAYLGMGTFNGRGQPNLVDIDLKEYGKLEVSLRGLDILFKDHICYGVRKLAQQISGFESLIIEEGSGPWSDFTNTISFDLKEVLAKVSLQNDLSVRIASKGKRVHQLIFSEVEPSVYTPLMSLLGTYSKSNEVFDKMTNFFRLIVPPYIRDIKFKMKDEGDNVERLSTLDQLIDFLKKPSSSGLKHTERRTSKPAVILEPPISDIAEILATSLKQFVEKNPSKKEVLRTLYSRAADILVKLWVRDNQMATSLIEGKGFISIDADAVPNAMETLQTLLITTANEASPQIAVLLVLDILRYFNFYRSSSTSLPKDLNTLWKQFSTKGQKRNKVAKMLLEALISDSPIQEVSNLSEEAATQLRQTLLYTKLQEWKIHSRSFDRDRVALDMEIPCLIALNKKKHIKLLACAATLKGGALIGIREHEAQPKKQLEGWLEQELEEAEAPEGLTGVYCTHEHLVQLGKLNSEGLKLLILEGKTPRKDQDAVRIASSSDRMDETEDPVVDETRREAEKTDDKVKKGSGSREIDLEKILKSIEDIPQKGKRGSFSGVKRRRAHKAADQDLEKEGAFVDGTSFRTGTGGDLIPIAKGDVFEKKREEIGSFSDFYTLLSLQNSEIIAARTSLWDNRIRMLKGEKPLTWGDIWTKLENVREEVPTDLKRISLNPLLKGYQLEEIWRLEEARRHSTGRLLALTMGLGKTAIYSDILFKRHFLKPKSRFGLILVPKNIMQQTKASLHNWFAESFRTAWAYDIQNAFKSPEHAVRKSIIDSFTERSKTASGSMPELMALLRVAGKLRPNWQESYWAEARLEEKVAHQRPLSDNKKLSPLEEVGKMVYEHFLSSSQGIDPRKKLIECIRDMCKCPTQRLRTEIDVLIKFLKKIGLGNLCEPTAAEEMVKKEDIEKILTAFPENFSRKLFGLNPVIHNGAKKNFLRFAASLLSVDPNRQIPRETDYRSETCKLLREFDFNSIVLCETAGEFEKSLEGRERRFLIANYETFSKILDNPASLRKQSIHTVILDEAQRINNPKTLITQKLLDFIKTFPDKPYVLPVTATPYENSLRELFQLLEHANPGLINPEVCNILERQLKVAKEMLSDFDYEDEDANLDEITQYLLKMWGQFEVLKSLLKRITNPLTFESQSVLDAWPGQVPKKIEKSFSLEQPPELGETFRKLQGRKKQIEFARKVLFHQEFFIGRVLGNEETILKTKELKDRIATDVDVVFANSPALRGLFRKGFCKGIDNGDHMIVILDRIFQTELVKTSIEKKFASKKVEVMVYSGDVEEAGRNVIIRRFKTKEKGISKVLILMEKAGGVGLDLPVATRVFHFDGGWNPAAREQALARAIRIGNGGGNVRVTELTSNFLERAFGVVSRKKRAASKFLFGSPIGPDALKEFCAFLEKSIAHDIVNSCQSNKKIEEKLEQLPKTMFVLQSALEKRGEYLTAYIKQATPNGTASASPPNPQPEPQSMKGIISTFSQPTTEDLLGHNPAQRKIEAQERRKNPPISLKQPREKAPLGETDEPIKSPSKGLADKPIIPPPLKKARSIVTSTGLAQPPPRRVSVGLSRPPPQSAPRPLPIGAPQPTEGA